LKQKDRPVIINWGREVRQKLVMASDVRKQKDEEIISSVKKNQ